MYKRYYEIMFLIISISCLKNVNHLIYQLFENQ